MEEAQTFLGILCVFLKIPLFKKRRDEDRKALKTLFLVEEGMGRELTWELLPPTSL